MKVAVCTISKDNHKYIEEWAKYYLNLGFDHVYIYDNNNRENAYNFSIDNVTIIPYYDLDLYQDVVINDNKQIWRQIFKMKSMLYMLFDYGYDYFLNCDDDEYLKIFSDKDIHSFLSRYPDATDIFFRWRDMDDSGYVYLEDLPDTNKYYEIYTRQNFKATEFNGKCIYKVPDTIEKVTEMFSAYDNLFQHFRYHLRQDQAPENVKIQIIGQFDGIMYHLRTGCIEWFLKRKSKLAMCWNNENNFCYFERVNRMDHDKALKFVELAKKYNVTLTEKDKEKLKEYDVIIP